MSMKKSKIVAFLALVVFICAIPFYAAAEVAPPKTLGAPEHLGAGHYYLDQIYFTLNAPDDLRDYIERRAADDPDNNQNFSAHIQIDYKIDGGNWHYTSDWDSPAINHKNIFYDTLRNKTHYLRRYERVSLSSMFPDNTDLEPLAENGWDYFKNHSITFRARYVESFDGGNTNVISNWSNEYTLSATLKVDPNKMINHAPNLLSADLKIDSTGMPYFDVISDRIHEDIMDLHGISSGGVRTEIWMRSENDKEFKLIHQDGGHLELFKIEARDYFSNTEQSYDAQSYEIKVRYALDMREIKQSQYAGSSSNVETYGPFSNVISHNMPAWSKTSPWAAPEVEKAQKNGLYPDKFNGADLTRPITRAEFAAVALKLYESLSGKKGSPAPASTFTDTKDLDVLTAYSLDIVAGVGNNKYAPDEYISREQLATMLTRVYKKVNWDGWTLAGDNTYTKHSLDNKGVPTFADDAKISAYAKPSVYFMAKYGIIVGSNNIFAPRNTTSAETAAGYASATREQALAISNRTFEKVDKIQDGGQVEPPAQPSPTPTPTPGQGTGSIKDKLIGEWSRGGVYNSEYVSVSGVDLGAMSIVNGEYYKFNADGTFRSVISTLGGIIGGIRYESMIVYETGTYKLEDNTIVFSNRVQTYYKGTPLVLIYKDKKLNTNDALIINEFDISGNRFNTILGWMEKQ